MMTTTCLPGVHSLVRVKAPPRSHASGTQQDTELYAIMDNGLETSPRAKHNPACRNVII